MNDTSQILIDTARRLFGDLFTPEALRRADAGEWLADAWTAIEEVGLPLALVPEEAGGFGVDMVDALGLLRIAGGFAAPVPLAETMIAAWLLATAGLEPTTGSMSFIGGERTDRLCLTREGGGWRLRGTAARVPWGGGAAVLAALALDGDAPRVVRVEAGGWTVVEAGHNVANEPRDTLAFDVVLAKDAVGGVSEGSGFAKLRLMGATARALALAGAIDRVLALTVQYAGERVQFGRPLGKFQAIQQYLAVVAGHAAASGASSDAAAEAVAGGGGWLPVAAAKVRSGEAAGVVASIVHQIHGAIGFTHEHTLHHFTRRLWAWREEFGNEAEWSRMIGRHVASVGADGLWPMITAA